MQVSVYIATSIDGFIARPDGDVSWLHRPEYTIPGEDYGYSEFMQSVDCLVMGRNTFEKILEFPEWPFPGHRVIVVSRSLGTLPQGVKAELSAEAPAALIARLRSEGKTRRVYADGGRLIQSMLREGLIDDLTLTRVPVILGEGIPLFGSPASETRLAHEATRSFASGLVQSRYRVLRS